ncbi:MAG: hypothetical protein ABS62_11740 [Microbacterium sp. SCN 70-200]|uniref:hypothetical protein n=1 Tax=unclassified Microbacterium TaxID=2609290 RepID=UPI00086EF22E|nr:MULTISPECIES: hypothetical protein [unclassified Microbacterium]MBN9215782.1 hypothetical protein [Microbacterium sp.]ODT39937.1 MAG: hypothetical protein ABS62_11740 [Microbacterium sp. SCN 70-200]OJV81960.1 MAG: hypothetical protein BGO46_08330 [Microbacterium sp. 70-16]
MTAPRRSAPARRNTRRRASRTTTELWAGRAALWAIVLVVVLGLGPQILLGIIGIIRGDIPAAGILGSSDTFPLFQPPFWLLWIPAMLMLAAAVLSLGAGKPQPLWLIPARWELAILAFVGLCITLECAAAYGGPQLMIVLWAGVPWLLAIVLLAVRGTWELVREAWRLWRP